MTRVAAIRRSGRPLLELSGLCGVAVAQPILAVFGAAPDWFVFHGVSSSTIVAFACAVAFLPPLVLWAVTELAGLGSDARRRLALSAAVGGLVGLIALQAAAAADRTAAVSVLLATAAAVVAGWAHAHWAVVRLWAAWLAPAPLVFLALFLFASPVSGLVTGEDVDPAELGAFGSGPPPPVVMLVLDEWPLASIVRQDGTIDASLYPRLAELAGASTWYQDTTTVANLTNFAVPALLTGDVPEDGDDADASTHPENLFTLLGGTYDLDVTERITRLCPTSLCTDDGASGATTGDADIDDLIVEAAHVYADRLTSGARDEPVTDAFVEPDAAVDEAREDEGEMSIDDLLDRQPESVRGFLRGIRRDEPPTFHFLHLLDPHTPYLHLPDGHQYGADPTLRLVSPQDDPQGGDERAGEEPPALLDRQRLQLELAHVDRLVGDVIDRLKGTGLWDDALVVVTSDHGIAFEPGEAVRGLGRQPIDPSIQPDLLWVPLFVKAPGQVTGAVSDVPAETIDVLPTIAAELGIDLPWTVDGLDLTAPVDPDRDRSFRHVAGSSFATFTLDPPTPVDADLADVLARGVDAVLPGEGPDRWWDVGPDPDAVGRRARGPRLEARFDDLRPFFDVDLGELVVPAVVAGRVAPEVERVAVVLNGRVAAVVDTYDDGDGPGRFVAIVPTEQLVDGLNLVSAERAD
jgi:hypothetical protein